MSRCHFPSVQPLDHFLDSPMGGAALGGGSSITIVYPENWTGGFVRMAVPRSGRRKAEDGTVQAAQRGVQGEGGAGIDQGAADGERDRRRVRGASRADRPVEEADAGGVAGALLLQEGQGGS